MKRVLICVSSFIVSLLIGFLTISGNIEAAKSFEQSRFLDSSKSDLVVLYSGESSFENDFYYLNKSTSIFDGEEKLQADILMLKKYSKSCSFLGLDSSSLASGELAISRNLSNSNSIEVNDSLILSSAFSEEKTKLRVTIYLPSSYSATVDYLAGSTGLIIMGYNPELIGDSCESLAFVSNRESLSKVAIDKILPIKTTTANLQKNVWLNFALNFIITLAVSALAFIALELVEASVKRTNIIQGMGSKALFVRYCLPSFFFSLSGCCGYLLSILIGMAGNKVEFVPINLWLFLVPFVLLFVSFLLLKVQRRRI